jgi:hypothetical protein
MLVTRVLYDPFMLYGVPNFDYIFVCDLYMCVSQYMDYVLNNLWCSNSKKPIYSYVSSYVI